MDILRELTPEARLSIDERSLKLFAIDIFIQHFKHYHSERSLNELKQEYNKLLFGKN